MADSVGANILNIITESLYDEPIVIFREYVQNSVDSFEKTENQYNDLCSKIWVENDDLYFLDNGEGIPEAEFQNKMEKIAFSEKRKETDIGYKGIGRLSGLSYCDKLTFININSYKNSIFQKYTFNGNEYRKLKPLLHDMTIDELIKKIGECNKIPEKDTAEIKILLDNTGIFAEQDTGFLVILENMSIALKRTLENPNIKILNELGWLLPVKFKDELVNSDYNLLFDELSNPNTNTNKIPAKSYQITFNDMDIERPIEIGMVREGLFKKDYKHAVGFFSCYSSKIAIEKGNLFTGIKVYLDNILLCDENELIPFLFNLGFLQGSVYETIQSVRGIGAMIYITDKAVISANARRTFIETTDSFSIDFLKSVAVFIESIFETRYALSKYARAKKNEIDHKDKVNKLRIAAQKALNELTDSKIVIVSEEINIPEFNDLSNVEQKKWVKNKIQKEINQKLQSYLEQTTDFDYDNAFGDFFTWLSINR